MEGNHLIGTNGRIEFTLEGLTFRRSKSAATARGVGRLHHVGWDQIEQAELARTGKGKPVVKVLVADARPVSGIRHDPHSLKVKRSMADDARAFVARVNDEVATRRRWAAAAENA